MSDPFDLDRFVRAQGGGVYEQALAELKRGRKTSHWMWFIFPQHRDLGRSDIAKRYGLRSAEDAAAYLAHPLLGPRWLECVDVVEAHLAAGETLEAIFGPVDAMKYRSSLDLLGA